MQWCLYDKGDKVNKQLAWLERREQGRNWVAEIKDEAGGQHTTGEAIAEPFDAYYDQIYSSMAAHTNADCMELLGDLPLVELHAEDREVLDQDITVEEDQGPIMETRSGKAVGPNGLPVELYKCMANIVAPHMLAMFQAFRKEGTVPMDQKIATTVVLHKDGKPHNECGSY
ncbi:hypothetical protein NDU88_009963 [Pleurodeles waltl]|uniref:Uncharacterized protein n=1 Tax=Pleurodeles waltl TaxID=8319 RepID=A0AAV7QYY0_PLEWA|nr:hypothetical protein NDU88_009963 [Pleurodeles waltl]